MEPDELFLDATKELLAVSSISSEIKSSVHSYLLAGSPRSDLGSQPVTPAAQSRQRSVVLSPWSGCVGASLDSYSPFSASVTPPTSVSPELIPTIAIPQASVLKCQCSPSPTRKRFHSPKSASLSDLDSFAFDLKRIPDLDDDVSRSSVSSSASSEPSSSSSSANSSPEARVDVECQTNAKAASVFGPRQGSVPDTLNLYTGFQFKFTSNKPPKHPRHARRLSGKFDAVSGIPKGRHRAQPGPYELTDGVAVSLISFLLLLLFIILVVYGGPVR